MDIIKKQKAEIRKEIIKRLRDQAPSVREERGRKVQEELLSSEEYRNSKAVMAYVSMPTEVDTYYLLEKTLEKGKKLYVPYVDKVDESIIASELTSIDDLVEGPFGTRQPKERPPEAAPLGEIDLIVVPGIAFDRKNMRLGRGKGYYDKFLAREELSSAQAIGLAFSFQVVDSLPQDPHDRPVSRVITD